MKNILFVFLFLLFFNFSFSQQNYLGLFGSNYLQTSKSSSDKMERVNKSISIIYNSRYCSFYIEGIGVKFFPIRSFSKTIGGGGFITSFVSQETKTTPDGYYGIIIQESNKGINFQVNLNHFTYFVDKVEKYSENGKVVGRVSLKNYDELIKQTKLNDSLENVINQKQIEKELKEKYDDSVYLVDKERSRIDNDNKKLLEGNNYNPSNIKWINDTLVKYINLNDNEVFSGDFKVFIDEKGIITKIIPNGNNGYIIEDYLSTISNIIIGRKVEPFLSKSNGRFYSSYSIIRVGLYHDPNKRIKKK